jgi:predicted dehydrogenase
LWTAFRDRTSSNCEPAARPPEKEGTIMTDPQTASRAGSAPLRAAIVGTGAIAGAHAEALGRLGDAELIAAADAVPGRAAEFAAAHGIPASYDSFDDLLAAGGIDVVHICTPPGAHAEQTLKSFEAGAHVIVEKPPALSLDELDGMIAAAARAGRELAVVFQQRTGSAAGHVRRLLADGSLGRPLVALCNTLWYRGTEYFDVEWRGKWATEGGGTTLSHGIHQLDLLAFLLGEWSSVDGRLWRLARDIQTEDLSTAVLRFENGAVASAVTSVLSPRETSSIRIDTERATITVDHLYGHSHANWSITPAPGVEPDPSWALPEVERESGHLDLLSQVYSSLRSGTPLPEVASDPARSFEIVAALYASSTAGAPVQRSALRDIPGIGASLESTVTDLRPGN